MCAFSRAPLCVAWVHTWFRFAFCCLWLYDVSNAFHVFFIGSPPGPNAAQLVAALCLYLRACACMCEYLCACVCVYEVCWCVPAPCSFRSTLDLSQNRLSGALPESISGMQLLQYVARCR